LPHPAFADLGDDFIDAETRAGREGQVAGSIAVSVGWPRLILPDGEGTSDSL
jgi:hypothetical protein